MHILMHSAFRSFREQFPGITIEELIDAIQQIITPEGSLIMPAFTYCFKKSSGNYEIFDRIKKPSKVGAVSEVFRKQPEVLRTASPTHSFALWGVVKEKITETNAPESPLGKGSMPDWLTHKPHSYVVLLGTDFSSLSYGHYLEIMAPIPWADVSPWSHLGVEKIGVSTSGEQSLIEIPGCSKSFRSFEKYLLERGFIKPMMRGTLRSFLIPVSLLYREGLMYYRSFPEQLLCHPGTCRACDERWEYYLNIIKNKTME